MGKKDIEGQIREVAGKAQEQVGEWIDDDGVKVKGASRKYVGKAQQCCSQALDQVRDFAAERPGLALAVAVGAGVLLYSLFSRRHSHND